MSKTWRFASLLALAAVLVAIVGCGIGTKPTLAGSWSVPETQGKPGSLSDLTLTADGKFIYAGKNALGVPVKFSGTYTTGTAQEGPWLKLVYADFPDRPTVWFYKLTDKQLTVSAAAGNLTNGLALVFVRK